MDSSGGEEDNEDMLMHISCNDDGTPSGSSSSTLQSSDYTMRYRTQSIDDTLPTSDYGNSAIFEQSDDGNGVEGPKFFWMGVSSHPAVEKVRRHIGSYMSLSVDLVYH